MVEPLVNKLHAEEVKELEKAARDFEEGDTFCEEDGEFIGTYECTAGPPIELSILYKGHWFIYKLDRKEKYENDNESTNEG